MDGSVNFFKRRTNLASTALPHSIWYLYYSFEFYYTSRNGKEWNEIE